MSLTTRATLKIDVEILRQLETALDEYDNVIESIQYRHRSDPYIKRINLNIPVVVAARLSGYRDGENPSGRLRENMEKAIQTEKSASILLPNVKIEVSQLTPTSKLTSALKESVSNERLQILFSSYQGDDLHGKVDRIIWDHRVVELIGGLTDSEQAAVIRFLNGNKVIVSTKKTKAEKVDEILTGLGIYKGRVIYPKTSQSDSYIDGVLKEKIAKDEFDVFMAHNSKDKSSVNTICSNLRQKGIYPWIDIEQIPPGRWFQDVIQAVISRVKCAAIVIGEFGIGKWQKVELRAFISQCAERDIPVIPILLPGVKELPQDLVFLHGLNAVQFHNHLDEPDTLERLIWGITGKKSFMET